MRPFNRTLTLSPATRRGSFALATFVSLASATMAAPSSGFLQKVAGASTAHQMEALALQDGQIRVIALFASPVAPSAALNTAAGLANVTSQVASARNAILNTHFGTAANPAQAGIQRGLTNFPITPGFAVNVTPAELEALAADPRIVTLQHDTADRYTLIDSVPLVGMAAAYTGGATGLGRTVAVLDTGIKANHEFLTGKVIAEACFSNAGGAGGKVSLCPNGTGTQTGTGAADANTTQCNNGTGASFNLCYHGTHVASTAAGFNTGLSGSEPPYGVAKFASIFAIQVFTRFNDTASCGSTVPCVLAYTSDQISALNHVLANTNPGGNPVASINMSLGGGSFLTACDSDSRKSVIDSLLAAGIITAIASGNNGSVSSIGAPGCISTAFTVGSSSKLDVISSFSNNSDVVDIIGPGGQGTGGCTFTGSQYIVAPVVQNDSSTTAYGCLNGTSMATPHVAGAIAAIKSACPAATPLQIENALINTGLPIADTRAGGAITRNRIRVDSARYAACHAGHDFNADRKSDILWRDTAGNTVVSLLNGAAIASSTFVTNLPSPWSVAGTGDFNGDGKSDILWRDASGNTVVSLMNGAAITSSTLVVNLPAPWIVAGTGDFNGDGATDILWRNTSTGDMVVSFMVGGAIAQSTFVVNLPAPWTVAGTGDFNGDGVTDILWRNTATGDMVVSFMSGGAIAQSTFIVNLPAPWAVAGVADFNGDGMSDILWRNTSTGDTVVSFVVGTTIPLSSFLVNLPAPWSVALVGDVNGDGRSDIFWRNLTTGDTVVSIVNGTSIASSTFLVNLPTSWVIQGTNAN